MAAPSVERVLTAWLSTLGQVGTARKANDPVPQRIVTRVDGSDVPESAHDRAVVSIHTFAASEAAAVVESGRTHDRMVELILNPLAEIEVLGGLVEVDSCECLRVPTRVDWADPKVVRYVGRYALVINYL